MASITKRLSKTGEASYLIRAFVAWGQDGKQITKSMTWKPPSNMSEKKARKEAEREALLFEENIKRGVVTVDGKTKFGDYAQSWLENKEIAVSTLENRYKYLLGWVNQAIGHVPLEKLQVEHLQTLYKNLREDGVKKGGCYATPTGFVKEYAKLETTYKAFGRLSGVSFHSIRNAAQGRRIYQSTAQKISTSLEELGIDSKDMFLIDEKSRLLSDKTIHDVHFLIHTILDTARKRRIIPHCITEFMEPPRVSAKEARHLDDEGAKRFLIALMDEPDIRAKTALTILLFTGIRRGELCGLEWGDIGYNEGLIRIRKASQYVAGHGILETPPKTKGSVRDIVVTPFVLDVIREYRRWWMEYRFKIGDQWHGDKERLFINKSGGCIYPNMINAWLTRFLEKNDLPKISPHSLRHTFITLQISAGVDIRTLQSRSGHSNPTTLLNVYSHAIQSAQDRAAQAMDDILLPAIKQA